MRRFVYLLCLSIFVGLMIAAPMSLAEEACVGELCAIPAPPPPATVVPDNSLSLGLVALALMALGLGGAFYLALRRRIFRWVPPVLLVAMCVGCASPRLSPLVTQADLEDAVDKVREDEQDATILQREAFRAAIIDGRTVEEATGAAFDTKVQKGGENMLEAKAGRAEAPSLTGIMPWWVETALGIFAGLAALNNKRNASRKRVLAEKKPTGAATV